MNKVLDCITHSRNSLGLVLVSATQLAIQCNSNESCILSYLFNCFCTYVMVYFMYLNYEYFV